MLGLVSVKLKGRVKNIQVPTSQKHEIYGRRWSPFFNEVIYGPFSKRYRSSRSQMFFKLAALNNFANFTGKDLCCSFFLIKLQP